MRLSVDQALLSRIEAKIPKIERLTGRHLAEIFPEVSKFSSK